MSGDPEQVYFSDGITDDVITELSRFRDLVVIARQSSFAFKGKFVDAAEVGRRLGVRFLVEGSVRKAGERVRITAQLIEADSGAHLWAERYDRTLEDVFAVQDEVVATIAGTLAGRIEATSSARARRKPTMELAAYDCVLRGMEHLAGYGEGTNAEAQVMFERATTLDPGYALAKAFLALTIYVDWAPERPEALKLERALALAREAVALDGDDEPLPAHPGHDRPRRAGIRSRRLPLRSCLGVEPQRRPRGGLSGLHPDLSRPTRGGHRLDAQGHAAQPVPSGLVLEHTSARPARGWPLRGGDQGV